MGVVAVTDSATGAAKSVAESGLDNGTKAALIGLIVFLLIVAVVCILKKKSDKKAAAEDAEADKRMGAMTQLGRPTAGEWNVDNNGNLASVRPMAQRTQRESVVQWCNHRQQRDGWGVN